MSSILKATKCLSPVKAQKNKIRDVSKLVFASPKSESGSLPVQREKALRARATIKKMLEQEAERNEELSEENEILEKQIKKLIALLVEKDEKIAILGTRENHFKLERTIFFEKLLAVFRKYKQAHTLWAFNRIQFMSIAKRKADRTVTQKHYSIKSLCAMIRLIKKRVFIAFCEKLMAHEAEVSKKSVKSFLHSNSQHSRLLICFKFLNSVLIKSYHVLKHRYFKKWSSPSRYHNLNIFHVIKCLLKPVKRRFQGAFVKKPSRSLAQVSKDIALLRMFSAFSKLSFYFFSAKSENYEQEISELKNLSASCEANSTKNSGEIDSIAQENSALKSQLESQKNHMKSLEADIFNAERLHEELTSNVRQHLNKIGSFDANKSEYQQKSEQEIFKLQEKIRKQQEFFKNANIKLQQLVDKHQSVSEENELIASKNALIQNNIKKLHDSYTQTIDDKAKCELSKTKSKSELASLSSTCQTLEDEISSMKSQVKSELTAIAALKEEISNKVQKIQHSSEQLRLLESSNSKLANSIKSLQSEIEAEAKTNEFELEECNLEIQSTKDQLNKCKDDIESLKTQLNEASTKVKISVNRPNEEYLESYIKILETQVQKLKDAAHKQKSYDIEHMKLENAGLQQRADKLEKELNFVNSEAMRRRQEVAQIMPEIQNYANILAVMEEKIAENDENVLQTEVERDKIRAETKIIRSRYVSLISDRR